MPSITINIPGDGPRTITLSTRGTTRLLTAVTVTA